jgi:hypothetical protein
VTIVRTDGAMLLDQLMPEFVASRIEHRVIEGGLEEVLAV